MSQALFLILMLMLPASAAAQSGQPPVTPQQPTSLYQGQQSLGDPTRLTTEQLFREIGTLEKSLNGQLSAIIKNADEFKANLTHFPTEIDQKIAQLEKLQTEVIKGNIARIGEQFAGIAIQFKERDVRGEQATLASNVAINAALQAQEKQFTAQALNFAASLAEVKTTFGKQIDALINLQSANTRGLEDKINGFKDQVNQMDTNTRTLIAAINNQVTAINGRSTGAGDSWGIMLGAGGLILGVGSFLIVLLRAPVVRKEIIT